MLSSRVFYVLALAATVILPLTTADSISAVPVGIITGLLTSWSSPKEIDFNFDDPVSFYTDGASAVVTLLTFIAALILFGYWHMHADTTSSVLGVWATRCFILVFVAYEMIYYRLCHGKHIVAWHSFILDIGYTFSFLFSAWRFLMNHQDKAASSWLEALVTPSADYACSFLISDRITLVFCDHVFNPTRRLREIVAISKQHVKKGHLNGADRKRYLKILAELCSGLSAYGELYSEYKPVKSFISEDEKKSEGLRKMHDAHRGVFCGEYEEAYRQLDKILKQ